jgi:transketolase
MSKNKENWRGSRDGFGEALVKLGEINPNVVVLTCDLSDSTRAEVFRKKFPDRFFQFGVAEQNMMSIAAGMSLSGYIPYVCTYAVFSTGRCWEQLRMSVCYSNCNVKIEGSHSGVQTGADGASHQATEDIAITRVIPNLKVVVPCDAIEARKATISAVDIPGPVYIRVGREPIPVITTEETPFNFGEALVLREGKDVTVIACGIEVHESLLAAEEMEKERISVGVVNLHTIKPVDEETIVELAKKTGAVVTAEEHQVTGGLGGAVAEVLSRRSPVPIEMVGLKDKFGVSGPAWELMKHFGLDSNGIIEAIRKVLARKSQKKV